MPAPGTSMEKRFDPARFEQKWQRFWTEHELFRCPSISERPAFAIMIPPPNVTGKLHIGHALQTALQDLLVRWRRMHGENALWLPGTDHAGIATQLMVERQLEAEGEHREALGRERFLERMWQWKEQYQGNIRQQLDLLGASCDWSRERFTLDEGLSVAVREAFVRLFDEGLIYRGEYIVNWSPTLRTAVSDLEVEMKPVQGKLYHVAYPIEGGAEGERIVVATTRPETMLGDTGIALHPEDTRYRHLVGKAAILPLVGRRIPFVLDDVVDPEFGTGLVKVTPFHDPNDFEIGQRHGLERIQVIGRDGKMTAAAGEFAGLDRFEARRQVVERLQAEGFLIKIEDHAHNVGHSQRGGEVIEPLVSTQWFCNVEGMAARALEAVETGALTLVPESYNKTWEHWLSNIKPWCISRQLWWGHQIPAWYDAEGQIYVGRTFEDAAAAAGTTELTQDEDVLDTWFSSALWPFSTLGWPEPTEDLKTFYPTDVLITGHDILFFWVARMVMTGLHFTDQSPFHTVHLTGLVRDGEGQKMSKTRGNTVDPLDLVDEYGADTLRFTLTILDIPGRDIPLDLERMAGYRAFCNKIWNATRFALSRLEGEDARVQADPAALDATTLAAPEQWILSRLSATAAEVDTRFGQYRFDEACQALYRFFWHELCDWYLELCKPAFSGDAPRPRVGDVLLTVLDRSLRLLHPVMPYLTEEVWQRLPGREAVHPVSIAVAPYPEAVPAWANPETQARIEAVQAVITRARAMRAEQGVSAGAETALYAHAEDPAMTAFLAEQEPLIHFLCRVTAFHAAPPPEGASRDLVAGIEVSLVAERQELAAEERERLERDLAKIDGEIRGAEGRLTNESFLAKAPPQVVEGNRQRLAELQERRQRILASLEA